MSQKSMAQELCPWFVLLSSLVSGTDSFYPYALPLLTWHSDYWPIAQNGTELALTKMGKQMLKQIKDL